jgi:transposase
MLHHDNAPCHTAISINEFVAEKRIPVFPQPPYLPDLSPYDFFLFPQFINHLKGRHLRTLDNSQKSVTDKLKGILAEAFQHCCEQWKQRLCRCVAAQGKYFEGDNLDL